jgi:hypothetical protein
MQTQKRLPYCQYLQELTAEFMSSFYRLAFAKHDVLSALAETQRNALVRLRQEESLGVAIQKVGPFVLTVQTGLK